MILFYLIPLIIITYFFLINKAVKQEVNLASVTEEERAILLIIDSCKTPEQAVSCQNLIFNFKDKAKGIKEVSDRADALMFYLDQKYITLN